MKEYRGKLNNSSKRLGRIAIDRYVYIVRYKIIYGTNNYVLNRLD